MKQNFKKMMIGTGILVILAMALYSCGGGSYGGGGGGAMAPGAFSLLSPVDLASSVTTTPTLSWTAQASATDYRVQVDTTVAFTAPLIDVVVSATTYSYTVPSGMLTAGTPYHWRVVAENAYGQFIAGPSTFTP